MSDPRILAYRSITLTHDSANAWREAGVRFFRRRRSPEEAYDVRIPGMPILNLGSSRWNIDGSEVWNGPDTIQGLLTPQATAETLWSTDLMRLGYRSPGLYWVKPRGRGGNGKFRREINSREEYDALKLHASVRLHHGIVQKHFGTEEYRAITVGTKVVQGMRRFGENGDRRYEWTGSSGLPSPIRQAAKDAAAYIPAQSVVAWDLGYDPATKEAVIFEGNTCPGVNASTADRIVSAMLGEQYVSRS